MTTFQPGEEVEIWGPLGNGFPEPAGGSLMMIAGGIGPNPFLATAREALGLHTYGDGSRDCSNRPDR
ncbi:MAG: hypothetical protein R3C11_25380 [Planctomycetaceae bacterium]